MKRVEKYPADDYIPWRARDENPHLMLDNLLSQQEILDEHFPLLQAISGS